jgi:anti-anti-sigma factor
MQRVVDTATLVVTRLDSIPGLALYGDLGAEHAASFARVLRQAAADHPRADLSLDCARLDTVSVEGLRAVADFAAELARAGRTLTLRNLSPYFHRTFRLTGWDETPGLILDGASAARSRLPGWWRGRQDRREQ